MGWGLQSCQIMSPDHTTKDLSRLKLITCTCHHITIQSLGFPIHHMKHWLGNINLQGPQQGQAEMQRHVYAQGPGLNPRHFPRFDPAPHPLPPLITIGALLLTPKHVRGTASEKPQPGPRRLFQSPSHPRNCSQTPIQRDSLLAGGPEQRLELAGCGYSRAER